MEKQQARSPEPSPGVIQSPALYQSEISEDVSHLNPTFHTITIRFNLPKDLLQAAESLVSFHKEKMKAYSAREATPEFLQLRERAEAYRKMDERSRDEERKKNSDLYRASLEIEYSNLLREKVNYPVFECFEDRGKYSFIRFAHRTRQNTNILQLKMNKHYIFEELKMTRNTLLGLAINFVTIWHQDYYAVLKNILRLSFETDKSLTYNLFVRSMDLIAVTFDIQYSDKRIYRFRYSPFEFRSTLFNKENHYLCGYNQKLSLITDISSIKQPISDQEFYSAPRYFIFDDVIDSSIGIKLFQRANIFFIAYSISRGATSLYPGVPLDADEYCKKCMWNLYFSTTRLKKFIFTWPFRPYRKNSNRQEQCLREIELPSKEVIFHAGFYIEVRDPKESIRDESPYKIKIQFHEPTRQMHALPLKQEILQKVREWYALFTNRDSQRERPGSELETAFGSRDRFDRFLVGLLVIVSTFIDRNYFTLLDQKAPKGADETKTVVIETPEIPFEKDKHGHWIYFHWLEIHFQHKILPYLFHHKEGKDRYYSHSAHKGHDFRIKCGEWRLSRVCKAKREWNKKHKKGNTDGKLQEVPSLPEIFRSYVEILLRHFPLRHIYKDIVSFLLGMLKICYLGWEESNDLHINARNQAIIVPIISAVLSLYYYAPFASYKERDEKSRQRMSSQQYHSDRHERQPQDSSTEEEKARRQDRLIDQFPKVIVMKVLTKGDPGFMAEERLLGELTFRLMDFKMCWVTRVREGVIMLRIFQDRIEFQKEYQKVEVLKFQQRGKYLGVDEKSVREILQRLSLENRPPLVL